jgi:hypothetical protein
VCLGLPVAHEGAGACSLVATFQKPPAQLEAPTQWGADNANAQAFFFLESTVASKDQINPKRPGRRHSPPKGGPPELDLAMLRLVLSLRLASLCCTIVLSEALSHSRALFLPELESFPRTVHVKADLSWHQGEYWRADR